MLLHETAATLKLPWTLELENAHKQTKQAGVMAPAARLSGLQKDVLALYRSILRETIRKDRKPSVDNKHLPLNQLLSSSSNSSTSFARDQFRKEASLVKRSDFKTIEYKIRKGQKQLKLLKMPGVNLVGGA
jgi:succinate dehydrogenase assembly factor 1